MTGSSLEGVMENFTTLVSLHCRNFCVKIKVFYVHSGIGTMERIMTLKDHSAFKFMHSSRFPKVFKGQRVCFQDVCRPSKQ